MVHRSFFVSGMDDVSQGNHRETMGKAWGKPWGNHRRKPGGDVNMAGKLWVNCGEWMTMNRIDDQTRVYRVQ